METKKELSLISKYIEEPIKTLIIDGQHMYQLGLSLYSDYLLESTYAMALIKENADFHGLEPIKTEYKSSDIKNALLITLDNIQTINVHDLECRIDGTDYTVNLPELKTTITQLSGEYDMRVLNGILLFINKQGGILKGLLLKNAQPNLF